MRTKHKPNRLAKLFIETFHFELDSYEPLSYELSDAPANQILDANISTAEDLLESTDQSEKNEASIDYSLESGGVRSSFMINSYENENTICESSDESKEPKGMGVGHRKFFRQRYDLFHKFDEGIQMDDEGFFSVTPERIAAHIASKVRTDDGAAFVWDAFAGVGGNAIQFALAGAAHVIATDTNWGRLLMAKHNSQIYGVSQYIDYICGDSLRFPLDWRHGARREASKKKTIGTDDESRFSLNFVGASFASPPWGGPSYLKAKVFDALRMLPVSLGLTLEAMGRAGNTCVLYLPRHTDIQSLLMYLKAHGHWKSVELEHHWLDDRPKVAVLYCRHVHEEDPFV
jgi:hypothetical protein